MVLVVYVDVVSVVFVDVVMVVFVVAFVGNICALAGLGACFRPLLARTRRYQQRLKFAHAPHLIPLVSRLALV